LCVALWYKGVVQVALLMTRPTRNPKTQNYEVRKAVPAELRAIVGQGELKRSLGTKDPKEAARLAPDVVAEFNSRIEAARAQLAGRAANLTPREVSVIIGQWRREEVARIEREPGTLRHLDLVNEHLLDQVERDPEDPEGQWSFKLRDDDLARARALLRDRGVPADEATIRLTAERLLEARIETVQLAQRRARGDWTPDTGLFRYPEAISAAPAKPADPLPAEDLLTAWAAETRPAASTQKKYAGAFRQVARVLGFDDLRRVTKEDVVKLKEARLGEGRDPGTVADEILAAGTVCKWGATNGKLADNPFAGLAPRATRRGPKSRTPYTDAEAAAILKAARKETGWRRWLPWLLAFSGARLSEVADMRRRDVREDGGVWVLDFVPLPGRAGKNDVFQRMVPLHPAVIAEGFLEYVEALSKTPDGPLFPDLTAAKDGSRTIAATSAHGRWVRDVAKITGADKAPAHSWRHRMEDELRKARAPAEVQDAITGRHNPRNAGAGYGKGYRGMPDETLKELRKVPLPPGV
jgi:integrase